jgi:uncharacterized membrane protein (UPF0136 family)
MSYHLATTSAGILLAAGSYAYLATGSLPSLIGSGALGGLFSVSAYLVKSTDQQCLGHGVGLAAGVGALAIGLKRYPLANKKLAPLTLIVIGVINVPYQAYKTYEWRS